MGINRIKINEEKSKLVGDVLFSEVENKVSAISPVPGGVGKNDNCLSFKKYNYSIIQN